MVTIVMPTCNNFKYLKIAIASIMQNTMLAGYKILVVESGNDGSFEWLSDLNKKFPDRFFVYKIPKEGSIKACNFGIKKANDDVYLTQDDVIIPFLYSGDWLFRMCEEADDKSIGLITTIGGGGLSGPDYIENFPWCGTWSLFIPKRTQDKIGYFDEQMKIGEDIDYTYRVIKSNLSVKVMPFWFEHHQLRETEHAEQSEDIKKEAGIYFKKKHNLT